MSKTNDVKRVLVEGSLLGTASTTTVTVSSTTTLTTINFNPPILGASIEVRPGAATSPDADEAIVLCVDAVNDTVAQAWLDESNNGPRVAIKPDDGVQNIFFNNALVTRMDLLGVGTSPDLDVTVIGIS